MNLRGGPLQAFRCGERHSKCKGACLQDTHSLNFVLRTLIDTNKEKSVRKRGQFLKRWFVPARSVISGADFGESVNFCVFHRSVAGHRGPPSLQGGMAMGGQGVGPGAGAVVRYLAGMWVVAAVTILIRTHCKQSSLTSIQLTGTV